MMKRIFFTIVALTACLYLSAQGVFEGQDCHNLRSGDVVEKQQIGYKEAGRSGENVLWNIGDIEVMKDQYEVEYASVPDNDSIIAGTEHGTRYYYGNEEGQLQLRGYENHTTKVVYNMPETILQLPLTYGEKVNGCFHGVAAYSERVAMRLYGTYEVETDATGMMILPEGDTLQHVKRVHSKRITAKERLGNIPIKTTLQRVLSPSATFTTDSIIAKMQGDSTLLEVNTYRWYAEGYRYPIYETVTTGLVGKEPQYTTAYYCPPDNQDVLADEENRVVRNLLAEKSRFLSGWDKKAIDSNHIGENTMSKQNLQFNYNVNLHNNETLSVDYFNASTAEISCGVYTVNGMVLTEQQETVLGGAHSCSFDLSQYPQGVYLVRLLVNEQSYTEKIAKK
ncbi:MAG: T9SS type A sorting domain-containing protein [Prevotella sp.]|nr:T9SS type A sorting domain-containing protein [Prevotella sp.]